MWPMCEEPTSPPLSSSQRAHWPPLLVSTARASIPIAVKWLSNRRYAPPRGFETRSFKNSQCNGNNGDNRGGDGAQLPPPNGLVHLGRQQQRPVGEVEAATASTGLQEIMAAIGDQDGGE